MEHLLDWHLIYRNARQLSELCPPQAPAAEATACSDVTGVNLFLEVRKPSHA
jgi:extracellular factor (EF) 3-hydroxypalmitic acid methyl ester biosynthesis protein